MLSITRCLAGSVRFVINPSNLLGEDVSIIWDHITLDLQYFFVCFGQSTWNFYIVIQREQYNF